MERVRVRRLGQKESTVYLKLLQLNAFVCLFVCFTPSLFKTDSVLHLQLIWISNYRAMGVMGNYKIVTREVILVFFSPRWENILANKYQLSYSHVSIYPLSPSLASTYSLVTVYGKYF